MTTLVETQSASALGEKSVRDVAKLTKFTAAHFSLWAVMLLALAVTSLVLADALHLRNASGPLLWNYALASAAGLVLLTTLPFLLSFVVVLKLRR